VRYFLNPQIPPFRRVLLVESGSRYLLEDLIPGIFSNHPDCEAVDLVTCFPGLPSTYDPARGQVFRVWEYPGRARRKELYAALRANRYDVCGIICSGEPIMTKWKWALAARLPAKVFILNENGDYFWFDRTNWRTIRHFALFRLGLSGMAGVRTLAGLAALPFTLSYLLLYAATVHVRRKVRQLV
jgi:hypothetical protein